MKEISALDRWVMEIFCTCDVYIEREREREREDESEQSDSFSFHILSLFRWNIILFSKIGSNW